MKHLIWKSVLPLTIISFVTFTKWWNVELVDVSGGEILTGFPLPYVCPGWHTSLSLQIFVLELIVDLITYFAFWFLVVLAITKINKTFSISKPVTIALLSIAGLFSIGLVMAAINPDNIYTTTRKFDIKIKDTGVLFIWQSEPPAH